MRYSVIGLLVFDRDRPLCEGVTAADAQQIARALNQHEACWQRIVILVERMTPHSFDDVRRSDVIAAIRTEFDRTMTGGDDETHDCGEDTCVCCDED